MASFKDVISKLPLLSWRGIKVPCESAPLRGGHEQARRVYPYVDGHGHDNVGRHSYVVPAKLWFVETVTPNAMAEAKAFLEALEDGSTGKLVHPIRGTLNARAVTWTVDLNAGNRGGVSMEVEWEETRDDLDAGDELAELTVDPSSTAKAADAACESLDIDYPDGQPESSLLDAYNSVKGGVMSLGMSVTGKINQVMGVVNMLVVDVESLSEHTAYPGYDNLVMLYQQLGQLKETAEKAAARSVGTRITATETTVDAFAKDTGNTVNEIMGLNLSALNRPTIPAGTSLKYYK